MKIYDLVPDVDVLVNLAPEELAYDLLRIAHSGIRNGMVNRQAIIDTASPPGQPPVFDRQQEARVEVALIEALHWLEVNGLLLPSPGANGNNGFRFISRRGEEVLERVQFDSFRRSAAFPKSLLHHSIADRVWISLARGELDAAVFFAFRQVEEAVRVVGGFKDTDVGTRLMRSAFDKNDGPLSDQSRPEAEREALAHLFAGAIGSYKNPHSHRTVTIEDHTEAQEMVMLASHLLRIVDFRR